MNETGLPALLETPEPIRAGRQMLLLNFAPRSLEIDLSRPPEPGSFRFSLEETQQRSGKTSRRSPAGHCARPPADDRNGARAVSRRPERQSPAGQASDRRQNQTAKTDRPRRAAENRKHGPAERTDCQQKPARPEDAPESANKASLNDGPPEPVAPVEQKGAALPQKEVAATMKVPADETSLKATGAGAPTASAGPSAKTATSGFSAPQVPSQTATGGVKNVSPEGVQEPAVAVSGDAAAVKGKMGPALRKVSGETAPVPVAADAAENNPLAETQLKQISAPLTKGAVNDSISGQMTLPTPPTANSQETTGLSVKPSAGVTAALEEASEGRVAQIGSDKQSGQTGLFHGSHNPPGTVQASGAVTSSDAAVHPFEHELLKQITGKTVFYLKNGKSEARIDLKPELLGHMRLHVSTDNGQVTLKIMTESAWVRDIIESSINHLKNELHSHNLQIDRLDVSVSGESRDFANGNSQTADSQLASSDSALTGEDEPMTSDGEASQNPLEPNARVGLVDYFA